MGISVIGGGSGGGGGKIQKTEIIKSTQSWTAPADVTFLDVVLCGGGGGGARGFNGGAGGGGGSVDFAVLTVTPSTAYTITIGAGGAGQSSPGNDGFNGSASSFGALLSVSGGGQGTNNTLGGGLGGGKGGSGGAYDLTNRSNTMPTAGIGPYGEGGGARFDGLDSLFGPQSGLANYGIGGHAADSTSGAGSAGGSGVAVIKYWSAL
jgi:hypothetical protein